MISLPLLPDLLHLQSDVAIPLYLQVLWHFSHQVWRWLTLKIACNQENVTEGQCVTLKASVREVQTSLRKCDCFPATPSVRVADTGVCIPLDSTPNSAKTGVLNEHLWFLFFSYEMRELDGSPRYILYFFLFRIFIQHTRTTLTRWINQRIINCFAKRFSIK